MTNFHQLVDDELLRARRAHPPLASHHEALAVLLEEFEELKREVFKKHLNRTALFKELIQLAAMAKRYAEDLNLP